MNKQGIEDHANFIKTMEIDTAEAAFNLLKPSELKKSDVNSLPIFLLKVYFELPYENKS